MIVKEKEHIDLKIGGLNELINGSYERLTEKPKINHVTLVGDKSLEDIGVKAMVDEASKAQDEKRDEAVKTLNDTIDEKESSLKLYVQTEVGKIAIRHIVAVDTLPDTGEFGTMYLTPHDHSDENDFKDEWIWLTDHWEKIGNTDVDLSEYAKTADVDKKLADALTKSDNGATDTQAGLMTPEDKQNLDNLQEASKTAVKSVAGRTGDVTLNWSDVGSKPDSYNPTLTRTTATLSASGWGGGSPYYYNIGYAGKTVYVAFNSNAGNTTQLAAAQAANIQGGNNTYLYAYGTKPTVDIPVILTII